MMVHVETYDEAFASSVDDDYTISPNTAEQYIFNPDRVFQQDISLSLINSKPLSFTADDFPTNEDETFHTGWIIFNADNLLLTEHSPGDVSGRIASCQAFDFSGQNVAKVSNQNNNAHASDEVFGNSDLFDSSNFRILNMGVIWKDKLVKNAVPVNKTKTEELDFDLLNRLTSQSSSTQRSFLQPSEFSVNIQDNTSCLKSKPTNFDLLSKTSSLFSSNSSSLKLASATAYNVPVKQFTCTAKLTGYKTPSPLGLIMSSYTTDRSKGFNGMLSRFSHILVRTRSISYNCLFMPRTVSGFAFDIPEPKTFERRSLKPPTKPRGQRNIAAYGHVDAGKSTLMGNLLYLLGHVSSKQLAKYQWDAQKLGKASFSYAWILDQTSEERNRGVTMDIAQTSFETKSKRVRDQQ
ncbi:HBS1-like protein [Schistosoma japonicum]|nr:HBS1-like protein [Schistosoma japonicum]